MDSDVPSDPENKPAAKKGCLALLILLIVSVTIGSEVCGDKEPAISEKSSSSEESPAQVAKQVGIGEKGLLRQKGTTEVAVAIDEAALDESIKASIANDGIGRAELMFRGRLFLVEQNTPALLIDTTFAARKVRILAGQYYGKSGWVPKEWLVKE